MNYQWGYFFNIGMSSFTNSDGTPAVIGSAVFMSYAGAAFAFIMSMLGAYDNMGKTLVFVEDSMDDWLKRYSGGKYDDIIDAVEESELMQEMLNGFVWDLILYSSASFFHSCFLIAGGALASFWILLKILALQTANSSDWANIPLR